MSPVCRYPLAFFGLAAFAAASCGAVAQYRPAAAVLQPRLLAAVAAAPPAVQAARPKAAAKPAVKPRVTAVSTHRVAAKPAAVTGPATPSKPTSAPRASSAPRPVMRSDAYPYRSATTNAADPWGFTERQCVSYVAWRLDQAGHTLSNQADGWGSALNWDDVAATVGVGVGAQPLVGAVAHWNAGESSVLYLSGSPSPNARFAAGSYGHVAYVTAVYEDGSVQVAQYNAQGDRAHSSMRLRAPRYLVWP